MDSYTILKDKLGERIARAALQHFECLDGSGYRYGRTAEHISMDARIIAVADVFNAITCKRTSNTNIAVLRKKWNRVKWTILELRLQKSR